MDLNKKPLCLFCRHYKGLLKCEAYPSGIPADIISDEALHDREYNDQSGSAVFLFNPESRHVDLKELNNGDKWQIIDRPPNYSENNTGSS